MHAITNSVGKPARAAIREVEDSRDITLQQFSRRRRDWPQLRAVLCLDSKLMKVGQSAA